VPIYILLLRTLVCHITYTEHEEVPAAYYRQIRFRIDEVFDSMASGTVQVQRHNESCPTKTFTNTLQNRATLSKLLGQASHFDHTQKFSGWMKPELARGPVEC